MMTGKSTVALIVVAALAALVAGCADTGGDVEELEVEPRYDSTALDGYTGEGEEALYAFPSGEAEEGLRRIVVDGESPPSAVEGDVTLVAFRGVFPTGGYAIEVNNVTRRGNRLTVHATYTDPSEDAMVTQAFTQPAAYVPLELESGSYETELVVTRVEIGPDGEEVLERDEVSATREFTVR